MRIVVFGAGGGVGTQAVLAALDHSHQVVAAARTPRPVPQGATAVEVDVRDAGAVHRAVEGVDAVLWCVGVTARSGPDVGRTAMPHLAAAMQQGGVARLVTVSGAGVTVAGDTKGVGARLVSALTRRLARDLVLDKEAEHAVLTDTSLDWTEVRPPRLSEQPGTGQWSLGTRAPGLTARPVAKADVAAAMVDLAGGTQWLRQSPFVLAGGGR